ncbi:MAG TPA: ABC transporter permease, partial [Vicinamibacterales bacterium]|nr:ABC transporter permease [Vicinamibacterales bacterium]
MFGKRARPQADFNDEMQAHLDLEADRLIEEGMPPEAARVAAHKRFGSVAIAGERFYESTRAVWLDHLRQDVRSARRGMARYPLSCLVAILSLAGGIGATTATLTVRNVVFRNPPPLYPHPEQLSRVQVGTPEQPVREVGSLVPPALFAAWHDAQPAGSATAAATAAHPRDVRTADRSMTVPVRSVTPELFDVIGVPPLRGRISAADQSRHERPAILSYRVWQTLFDEREDALGASMWIDNQPYTVVAVMPQRFWFSRQESPIWTPTEVAAMDPAEMLEVIVRRAPGITPLALAAALQPGLDDYSMRRPAGDRERRLKVSGIEGTPMGRDMAVLLPWLIGTAVFLTLLIACANVAILMIAQWTAREHEIAIRAALGATRGRIVRWLLTESALIAICGGALGICAVYALLRILALNGGSGVGFFDLSLDPLVLLQSLIITLGAGLITGVSPALYETRRLYANPLHARSSDRVRQYWRHALVVLEISVTAALLVVTSTMVDGYRRMRAAEMGFRTQPLLDVTVQNPSGVPAARALEILRQVPGVASAAASTMVPMGANGKRQRVASDAAGSNEVPADTGVVSPDFFSTLDVPVQKGRAFTHLDTSETRTAIVNETLAAHEFDERDPIGGHIWIAGTAYEVVGVVTDYANDPFQDPSGRPVLFLPLSEDNSALTRV